MIDNGMRLVDRIRILVNHTGMLAYALDGFPRGQLSREKALYASTDEEGFLVLQVQASQYEKIAVGPITHVTMMTITAALSTRKCEKTGSENWQQYGWVWLIVGVQNIALSGR